MTARTHTIVQFTDTHLTAGELLHGGVDSTANLQRALDRAIAAVPHIDALLFTGDLADAGHPDAYRTVRSMAEAAASELGVPAIYGIGNHDERVAFRTTLLEGNPAPVGAVAAPYAVEGPDAPVDYTYDLNGLRIIMIDSTTPGHHHGEVEPRQLEWLSSQLADQSGIPTIVTLHHPPFAWDDEGSNAWLLRGAAFRDRSGLDEVLQAGGPGLVLSGHYHEPMAGRIGQVPLWAGGSTSMAHEFVNDPMAIRFLPSTLYSVIDVFEDGAMVARSANATDQPAVAEMKLDDLKLAMAETGHA